MQMQKSFSDMAKEARAQRQADRMRTPAGYYHGQGETAVLNLNLPGAFVAANTTGVPASQLSPPAQPVAVVHGGQVYSPGLWSTINPRTSPTNGPAVISQGGYGSSANPYRNTNAGYWSDLQLGSYKKSELGDFLTDLTQALTAGAQAYGQVTTAETASTLARVGIQPVGYSANGVPIYQSTPPGVTPTYSGMVPSGLVLPAGVTPSYQYPVGFVQQAGASGVYQIQPPSLMPSSNYLLPALAIGGGLLLLLAAMK